MWKHLKNSQIIFNFGGLLFSFVQQLSSAFQVKSCDILWSEAFFDYELKKWMKLNNAGKGPDTW